MVKAWSPASDREKEQLHDYALATFLLGTDGNSSFTFSRHAGEDRTVADPKWALDLGRPLAPYAKVGSVYSRAFEHGTVVVNPTGALSTIPPAALTVGQTSTASAVGTLAAHQGASGTTLAPYSSVILPRG